MNCTHSHSTSARPARRATLGLALGTLVLSLAGLLGTGPAHAEIETITYLHTDHLGSPILARDQAGNTLWQEDYGPWGEQLTATTSNPGDVGYTGHYSETELNLTYAGARWYDPEVGRFLSPDAVGYMEGGPVHFNRYVYGGNNPYLYVDPDGRMAVTKDTAASPTCNEGGCHSPWANAWQGGGAPGGRARVRVAPTTESSGSTPTPRVHKNSRSYAGETHVYTIRSPDGKVNKIGESAQGVRARDGASKRAEQQVRRLNREAGPGHTSEIRKTFPNKDAARTHETQLIERYRRMNGQDTLPGNKTNR